MMMIAKYDCVLRSNQIYLQDVPRIVLALLLISHDPSTSTLIKTEVTKALGTTLRNIERAKPKRGIQLVSRTIIQASTMYLHRWLNTWSGNGRLFGRHLSVGRTDSA